MSEMEIYQQLCKTMAERGGNYPGIDIPEFYKMARALFTQDEAVIINAMPRGVSSLTTISRNMNKSESEVKANLEKMADKGFCVPSYKNQQPVYYAPPFVPGIFEYQFMKGTSTEKDKRIAKLINQYKKAVDALKAKREVYYPTTRVIPVNEKLKAGNKVHTYDQVAAYLDRYDPISVCTCYCRHEAILVDKNDNCGKPMEVCMGFNESARYVIERGMGRRIDKNEALEILKLSAESGLVHCTLNLQKIDFICNCCSCHCMILKQALSYPNPGIFLSSGFKPFFDPDSCTACETCVDRCPAEALSLSKNTPEVNLPRCIGCGVCAIGCPSDAIVMEEKEGATVPPFDRKALREAASRAKSL